MFAPLADLEMLHRAGLADFQQRGHGSGELSPTPEAFQYYRALCLEAGSAAIRLDDTVRRRLVQTGFEAKFPGAFKKWSEAERVLWTTDSATHGTTVGHLVRESLQVFAGELISLTRTEDADPDPTKSKNRIRSVVPRQNPIRVGPRRNEASEPIQDAGDSAEHRDRMEGQGSAVNGDSARDWR
jgi:hypothetical protein